MTRYDTSPRLATRASASLGSLLFSPFPLQWRFGPLIPLITPRGHCPVTPFRHCLRSRSWMNTDRLDSSLRLRAWPVVTVAVHCPLCSLTLAIGCDLVDAVQVFGLVGVKRINSMMAWPSLGPVLQVAGKEHSSSVRILRT
jgi:hypothetical protein